MSVDVVVRGSGSIGQRHARVLRALGAEVGLWPVRDRGLGGEQGIDAATGARLLDDGTGPGALGRADLVVVATDTARHVADALAALDAGARRVLVEKPVAPTAAEADPLTRHPRAGAVHVAAPLRAHESFRHLAAAVPRVGAPVSAHVWCQSWLPDWRPDRDYRESYSARADEGGVLRDLVHEIDYATALLGEPLLAGAVLDHDGPLEMAAEQAATLLWSTPNASAVTVRLDYVTRPATRGILVRGPEGALEWTVATGTVRHTDRDGAVTEMTFDHDLDRDAVMTTQVRALLGDGSADERHTGAPATLREAVATVALCDAARILAARPRSEETQ
ncbi:MAG: Gfo/Idh/MocA family oxidoreductase [Terracoccus sp.]